MNISVVANIVEVIAVIFASGAAIWGIWRRLDTRHTESRLDVALMQERLELIQTQFGPNGGGLRQAVNEMSSKVDNIEEKVYNISQDVSKLSGEFHQHIVENNK
jgi:archaellum component FlaC